VPGPYTSYLICGGTATPKPSTPKPSTQCNAYLQNVDIPGVNLAGSGQPSASNQACLTLCQKTASCNAAIRTKNTAGTCYLKSVNAATVVPVPGPYVSYITCGGTTPLPAPVPVPAPAPVPVPVPVPAPVGNTDAAVFFGVAAGTCPGASSTTYLLHP
jgi:hypothetical protein